MADQRIGIDFDPQAGTVRNRKEPFGIQPAAISSIMGDAVSYFTRSVSANADAICRSNARPTAYSSRAG
jgi:hypothetical protein